jgi:hypothetical protein
MSQSLSIRYWLLTPCRLSINSPRNIFIASSSSLSSHWALKIDRLASGLPSYKRHTAGELLIFHHSPVVFCLLGDFDERFISICAVAAPHWIECSTIYKRVHNFGKSRAANEKDTATLNCMIWSSARRGWSNTMSRGRDQILSLIKEYEHYWV